MTRFYQQVLGRAPEPTGLAQWVNFVVSSGDLETAALGFLGSAEFEAKALTLRAYVTILYRALLGRDPDPAGLDAWEAVLRDRLLDIVSRGFVPSPEFQAQRARLCG